MKRTHPLAPFYTIIDASDLQHKISHIPPFPRIIEFEITNHCNFQCLMCKTGMNVANRNQGFMEKDIFDKVLDELEGKNTPLKFVGQGEPMMHPKAIEFIRKASKRGILCHLTTNASFLTEDKMDQLIKSGLASIKFSFQGVNRAGYIEMRQKDFFDPLHELIELLYHKRGEHPSPFITVCTSITDETPKQVADFKKLYANCCDRIEVGHTTLEFIELDKIRNEKMKERILRLKQKQGMEKTRYACCNQIFDTLTIHWNGTVTSCCADNEEEMALGNVCDQTLEHLWNCDQEKSYRKILSENRFDDIPLCSHCYDFMGYMKGNKENINLDLDSNAPMI